MLNKKNVITLMVKQNCAIFLKSISHIHIQIILVLSLLIMKVKLIWLLFNKIQYKDNYLIHFGKLKFVIFICKANVVILLIAIMLMLKKNYVIQLVKHVNLYKIFLNYKIQFIDYNYLIIMPPSKNNY